MPGVIAEPAPKARKPTKNEQRRAKKKLQKREVRHRHHIYRDFVVDSEQASETPAPETPAVVDNSEVDANHPIEPVAPAPEDPIQDVPAVEDFELPAEDPLYSQFANVFAKFNEPTRKIPP